MLLSIRDPGSVEWLIVGRVASVFSFLAFFSIIAYVYEVYRKLSSERRRRRLEGELAAGQTEKPVALGISFPASDITPGVRRLLNSLAPGGSFPIVNPNDRPSLPAGAIPIVPFRLSAHVDPSNVHRELERLKALQGWLGQEAFTEVLLFVQTPVALSCVIGALFTNWGRVHVFHFNHDTSAYEYWLPLSEAKRRASDDGGIGGSIAAMLAQIRPHPAAKPAPPSTGASGDAPE
jgi:hypothetical protein